MEEHMEELFDRTDMGKIQLTANNVYYWRALYKKSPNKAANLLLEFSYIENATQYVSTIYAEYIGMPELAFLRNDDSLRTSVDIAVFEATLNFMRTTDITRFPESRTGSLKGFTSALNCRTRHAAETVLLDAAKIYLPYLTRHTLIQRILAYKGGIKDLLSNHSIEEIQQAIATAVINNHRKAVKKGLSSPDKEVYVVKNPKRIQYAFDVGYEYKINKKDINKDIRKATSIIVNTYFEKDPVTRFVLYRFATKAPLTSKSKAVKHYFEKKGYFEDSVIDIVIKNKKSELRRFLEANYFNNLEKRNVLHEVNFVNPAEITKAYRSMDDDEEIKFSDTLSKYNCFLNLDMMLN